MARVHLTENRVRATCHPDRPHCARGLCAECYWRRDRKVNGDKRKARARAHAKAVRAGLHPAPRAECHPDRPHVGHGLCARCYHATPEAKARRKARRAGRLKPSARVVAVGLGSGGEFSKPFTVASFWGRK